MCICMCLCVYIVRERKRGEVAIEEDSGLWGKIRILKLVKNLVECGL